jgi:hypothetical protein
MEIARKRRILRLTILVGVLAAIAEYTWETLDRQNGEREIKALEIKCEAEKLETREAQKRGEAQLKGWLQEHPLQRDSSGHFVGPPVLPPGWEWVDKNSPTKTQRQPETCSAKELWTGDLSGRWSSEVTLAPIQQNLRDMYGGLKEPGSTASLVFAVFAIPWLWYFTLDRLRELSAAIQGKRD